MKNRLIRRTLPLMALFITSMVSLVLFSDCNHKSNTTTLVPDDAPFVIHCNLGSIWEKGDLDHLDQFTFIKLFRQEIKNEDPDAAKIINGLLEDPNSCGLNLKGEIVAFMSESMKVEACIGLQVNNAGKFKDFLKEIEKKIDVDISFSDEGNYTLAYSNDMDVAFCWDKNKAYIFPVYNEKNASKSADRLMALEESCSMTNNADFNAFMNDHHDVGFYSNYDNFSRMKDFEGFRDLGDLSNQLKWTSLYLTLNFERGSIKAQGKVLGLDEQAGQLFSAKFNKDLIGYLPQQTLAAFSLAYDMETLMKMAKRNGDVDFDEEITKGGHSIGEILKSFTGCFAASLSDIKTTKHWDEYYGYEYEDQTPIFCFVAELNNKRPIKETLDGMDNEGIIREGDTYYLNENDICIKISDNLLMVANDETSLNAFSKGGNNNGIEKIASEAKDGNYFYLNLDVDDYPSSLTKQVDKNVLSLLGGFFKQADAKLTGAGFEITVSLQNDDKNSLLYTLEYIDNNLTRLQRIM